jgi:hypothetical protein
MMRRLVVAKYLVGEDAGESKTEKNKIILR